ncbi:hypothetical protein V7S57_05165 [Caulobacter sp. CCNWLY153]|uniref:hypothetical protein n=2 Tax=Caulobacter TaxID=75 RepID=UPI002FF43DCD
MEDMLTAGRVGRKALVCDPVCVLPYGHAMPALNHYRRLLLPRFEDVRCLASKSFSPTLAAENDFEQAFTFLYNKYIPVMGEARFNEMVKAHPAFSDAFADPYERVATADAVEILGRHEIASEDTIFMPGADFYGIIGFLNACAARPAAQRPKIFIRLIGVLEAATPFYDDPMGELCRRIRAASAADVRLYLSAETPAYADYVNEQTGLITYLTPYPETSERLPLPETDDFNVLCAGSARLDKGFHHLLEIMQGVHANPPRRKVLLTTQTLPVKGSEAWDSYTSQLYATSGVTLLEPVISSELMHDLYRACDIVLLPYAQDVYRMRGSAVMMEAAGAGRLCLTLRGTAFSRQVEYYGLGEVVDTIQDIPDAIRKMAAMPRDRMQGRIDQARARFFLDINAAYAHWLSL